MNEGAMNEVVLEATGVTRAFRQGPIDLTVLQGVNLGVRAGERIAIIGASGSGKTTLLQILGGLDRPTAGIVKIAGSDIHCARRKATRRTAQSHAGFHLPVPSPVAGVLRAGKRRDAAAGAAYAAARGRAERARDSRARGSRRSV